MDTIEVAAWKAQSNKWRERAIKEREIVNKVEQVIILLRTNESALIHQMDSNVSDIVCHEGCLACKIVKVLAECPI